MEDDPQTLRLPARIPTAKGHAVTPAASAAEALAAEALAAEALAAVDAGTAGPFDLLVSDIGLPDVSGWELMQQLRGRRPTLPGIAVSGFASDGDRRRSLDCGFAGHLPKPLDVARLVTAIRTVAGAAAVACPVPAE